MFLSAVLGVGSLLSVSSLQAKEQEGLSAQEQATQLGASLGAKSEGEYNLYKSILNQIDNGVNHGVSMREATILAMNALEVEPQSLSPEMKAVLMENLVGADDGVAPADVQAQADVHIRSLYSGALVTPDFELWTQKQNKAFMETMARDLEAYHARQNWGGLSREDKEEFMHHVVDKYYEQVGLPLGIDKPDISIRYLDLPEGTTGLYTLETNTVIFDKKAFNNPETPFNEVMDTFVHEALGHGFHKELSLKPAQDLPDRDGLRQAAVLFQAEMDPSGDTNFKPSGGHADAILYARSPTENMSIGLARMVEVMGIFSADGKALSPEIEKRYGLYVQDAESKIDFSSRKAKSASSQRFNPSTSSNITL